MTDQSVRGRFIWHELMTPDTDESMDFYAESLGWKKVPWEADPSYPMFGAPSGPLGGAVASMEPPVWIPYVATPDLDGTVAEAVRLGAEVKSPPTPIPNGSRYAVLLDPQGACFAVYEPGTQPPPETAPGLGDFAWHELAALDWRSAFDFYAALFGWDKIDEHDMGPMGVYALFGRNGAQIGGMFDKRDQGKPGDAYWLGYVSVADVHATVEKIKAAGGGVAAGPMQVPGGAWIAQCMDPDGALFAVHAAPTAPNEAREPAAAAETRTRQPKKAAAKKTHAAAEPARPASGAADKAGKKTGKKKAAGKKTATKAAKKTGGKAGKKTAKKAAKKAGKKAAKKTAKKVSKKAGKKPPKKTAKKAAKKTAKKTAAKKAARKTGKKKSAGRKAGKATGKKRAAKRGGAKKASRAGRRSGPKRKTSKKPARRR